MKSKKKSKGFTTLELIVVLAIVGVFGALMWLSFEGAKKSARDAVREEDIKAIGKAMTLYKNDQGVYFQKATIPTAELSSLSPVPKDPRSNGSCNGSYCWNDNTQDPKGYCVYAILEEASPTRGNTLYFTADPTDDRQRDQSTPPVLDPVTHYCK